MTEPDRTTSMQEYIKWFRDAKPGDQITLYTGFCGTLPRWQRNWSDHRVAVFQKPVSEPNNAGCPRYRWFGVRISARTREKLAALGDVE